MKAHIVNKCKPCPFCGARADEIETVTGVPMIACSNYNGCGEHGKSPVEYFNRRAETKGASS